MKDGFLDACEKLRLLCQSSNGAPTAVGLDVPLAFSRTAVQLPQQVAEFERRNQLLLPESYRRFLTIVGSCELFVDPYGLGIVFPALDGLPDLSASVFDNAGADPFPELLLVASLTSRGDFAGFDMRSGEEKFAVFSHEDDPSSWLTNPRNWHRFSPWVVQLAASNGERDLP